MGGRLVFRVDSSGYAQISGLRRRADRLFQSPKLGSLAQLLVRRNSVVWQLEIQRGGLLVIPKPTLLAEVKKYATKQKARVGRG